MGWLIFATVLIVVAGFGLVALLRAIWISCLEDEPVDPPPPPPSQRVH